MSVGRYTLFGAIAQGGMASVHIGRVTGAAGFSRTVAIKRLHAQFAADPEFVSMFVDEARLAARIQHPNVVSVLDVVALDGELFLVMDFIRGDSLSKLMARHKLHGSLPPADVSVSIVAAALRGLHAAHEARSETGEPLHIVHRDVSPQNILVGVDGTARLVDFGIARAAHRDQSTREGQLKGKLDYMAPEQYENLPATRQTDVYAAAVVLWEALTGRRLLEPAGTPGAKVLRVLHGNFPAPSVHNSGVCRELDRIVLRGLARYPSDRFETAQQMAEALEEAVIPASTTRISAWLKTLAGDSLQQLEREITRVEALSDSALRRAPQLSEDASPSHSAIRIVSQPGMPLGGKEPEFEITLDELAGRPPQPRAPATPPSKRLAPARSRWEWLAPLISISLCIAAVISVVTAVASSRRVRASALRALDQQRMTLLAPSLETPIIAMAAPRAEEPIAEPPPSAAPAPRVAPQVPARLLRRPASPTTPRVPETRSRLRSVTRK